MARSGRVAGRARAVFSVMFVAMAAGASPVLLSSAWATNGQPITVEQYKNPRGPKDLIFNKTYLIGVKDGLIAYNMSTQHKMFCMPGIIPHLSFGQANDIVMRWTRRASAAPDLPVARALYYGLVAAYPCHH